jgi:hypothetical protein
LVRSAQPLAPSSSRRPVPSELWVAVRNPTPAFPKKVRRLERWRGALEPNELNELAELYELTIKRRQTRVKQGRFQIIGAGKAHRSAKALAGAHARSSSAERPASVGRQPPSGSIWEISTWIKSRSRVGTRLLTLNRPLVTALSGGRLLMHVDADMSGRHKSCPARICCPRMHSRLA